MQAWSSISEVVGGVLSEFEVTTSVAGVLWALDPASEPPTMRDLATQLHCDPSTISLTADKLEASGFVTRQPHATDGRKRILVLTDRGQELWQAMSRRLHSANLLAGLDDAERRTLIALLAKAQASNPRA